MSDRAESDHQPRFNLAERLIGYALLAGLLALFAYAIHGTARAWRYDHRAVQTQGELIDFAWGLDAEGKRIRERPRGLNGEGYLTYRFTVPTAHGAQRTVVIEDQPVSYGTTYDERVGEAVTVRYFPDEPETTALIEIDRTGEELLVWLTVAVVVLGIVLLCVRLSGDRKPESVSIPGGRRFRFSPFLTGVGRMMLLLLVVFFLLFFIVGLAAGDHGFIAVAVIVPAPFLAIAGYFLLRHAGTLSITAHGVERRRLGWSHSLSWDQIGTIERDHHLPANVVLRSPHGDLRFSLATSGLPYFHEMAANHLRPEASHAALARVLAGRGLRPELPLHLHAPASRRWAGLVLPPLLLVTAAAAIAWPAGAGPVGTAVASGIALAIGLAFAWVLHPGGDAVRELHCLSDRIRIRRARTGMHEIAIDELQGIALGFDPIPLGVGFFPLHQIAAAGVGTLPLMLVRARGENELLGADALRPLGLRTEHLALLLSNCYAEHLRPAPDA